MAADLMADLDEAQAEGGSPEDVLGNSAFDPRRFAAAWAVARGVTGPPPSDRSRFFRRPPLAIALTVIVGVVILFAGVVLLSGRSSSSIAFAVRRVVGPGSSRIFAPGPGRTVIPGPLGSPLGVTQIGGVNHPLALLLLLVAIGGIGLLLALYWAPWFGPGRRRHESRRPPGWN
jgi:hypothetical protein